MNPSTFSYKIGPIAGARSSFPDLRWQLPPALKRALSGVRVMAIVTVGDNDVIGVMAV